MAIYLGLVFAGLVVSAWLIHRDGSAIGREQADADRARRLRNLRQNHEALRTEFDNR